MKKIIVFLIVCIVATFIFFPKLDSEVSSDTQNKNLSNTEKAVTDEKVNRIEDFSQRRVEDGLLYIRNEKKPYSGKLISHYKNKQTKMEGDIKNGVPHGKFIMYYEDGQIEAVETYHKGTAHGEKIGYYKDGQLMAKESYIDGIKNGEFIGYYEDGQLKNKGTYKNDKFDGVIVFHSEDGVMNSYYNYDEGEIVEGMDGFYEHFFKD